MNRLFRTSRHFAILLFAASMFGRQELCAVAAQLEEMKFEEPTAAAHPHGDLQTLSELLVIARDRDRQLQVLEENLQANGNNSTGGADRPFLGPDSLSIDSETGEIKGHYAWQVRLLRNASPSVRQAWDRRWSTNASVALNQAVARRDAGAILSVARSYPLTSAGFEAAQLLMALLIEKGQVQQASILLRTCESVYGAIPPFERRMAALRRAMQEVMRRHGNGSAYGQRYANAELFPTVSETDSPPWPEPVWTWRGDNLLSSVPGISSGTHVSFCNWQPIISGDRVLVRSPKKLAALDRSTGEVLWSVRCDVQSENTEMTTRSRPRLSIDETIHFDDPLMSRAAFGNFTCDGQFVYFIDGFDASNRRDQYSNSPRNADPFGQLRLQLGGQQRLQLINPGGQDFPSDLNKRRGMGIRLVAVQLDAEQRSNPIAWILGDQSFRYRFDSGGTEHPGEGDLREKVEDDRRDAVQATGTEDVHSGSATNPFDGHSFLSSPVGYESRLFLLSTLNANQLLSCVERTTGELIWQQPLVYHESEPLAGVTDMSAAQTASSLHTWNDDVVCSLWNGIIVSCRQSDGALNWATCVVNDDLGIAATRQRLLDADQDSGIGFFSTLHGDLMVASSPGSALVSCVNVADGHLLWQAPRTNSQTKGADDHYVAGITDGNVVLVGSQHCRSLDLQSGMEVWTAEVIPSTGRAWCTGDLCLIPESNGRIAQVRVSDGTVYRCDPRVLPGGLPHISGTVTGDDQYVYVSDTVQVSAFLRNDVLLQRMEKREAAQPTLTDFLKYARSLVLGDKTHEAIRLAIRTLDSQPSAQPEESQQRVREALETFAAELILSTAYESFVNRDSTSGQTDLAVDEVIGYLDWLRHVRLARQHSVLFHLLAVAYGVEELDLSRMQKNGRWFRDNVTMTESWQISPMLVANAIEGDLFRQQQEATLKSLARSRQSSVGLPVTPADISVASTMLADDADAAEEVRESLADRMLLRGDLASAEVLLLSESTTEEPQHEVRLRQLRSWQPALESIQKANGFSEQNQPEDQSRLAKSSQVTIGETLQFRTTDAISTEIDQSVGRAMIHGSVENPFDLHRRFLFRVDQSQLVVSGYDLTDGSCTDRVHLDMKYLSNAWSTISPQNPSLIVLSSPDSVAAISVVRSGSAKLLWDRPIDDPVRASSRIEIGSIGRDHLIVRSASRLHRLHPLTGQVLWSNACPHFDGGRYMFRNEQILGDEATTLVGSTGDRLLKRYSTVDGRRLTPLKLDAIEFEGSLVLGGRMLCRRDGSHLALIDITTQQDLFTDHSIGVYETLEPVIRAIDRKRAVAVSNQQELLLIDVEKAQLLHRIPFGGLVNTRYIFGMTAFRRSGRLFVCINDEQEINQRFTAAGRLDDLRLQSGTLMCIDETTGRVLWHRRVDPCVAPSTHDDRCPYFVMWTYMQGPLPAFNQGFRSRRIERKMRLQVVSMETGELLAEDATLYPANPIRATWEDDLKLLKLYCSESILTVATNSIDAPGFQ